MYLIAKYRLGRESFAIKVANFITPPTIYNAAIANAKAAVTNALDTPAKQITAINDILLSYVPDPTAGVQERLDLTIEASQWFASRFWDTVVGGVTTLGSIHLLNTTMPYIRQAVESISPIVSSNAAIIQTVAIYAALQGLGITATTGVITAVTAGNYVRAAAIIIGAVPISYTGATIAGKVAEKSISNIVAKVGCTTTPGLIAVSVGATIIVGATGSIVVITAGKVIAAIVGANAMVVGTIVSIAVIASSAEPESAAAIINTVVEGVNSIVGAIQMVLSQTSSEPVVLMPEQHNNKMLSDVYSEDTRKAITYYELALKMKQALYQDNHSDVADSSITNFTGTKPSVKLTNLTSVQVQDALAKEYLRIEASKAQGQCGSVYEDYLQALIEQDNPTVEAVGAIANQFS